jgi:hypothetical protein
MLWRGRSKRASAASVVHGRVRVKSRWPAERSWSRFCCHLAVVNVNYKVNVKKSAASGRLYRKVYLNADGNDLLVDAINRGKIADNNLHVIDFGIIWQFVDVIDCEV